ncbi:hypothetical protein I2494_20060 [Budviciaceae bacterium BWR-B9]|uniref:Uncharacterized protein n=1 Tax=Limnobaculum allomyrinae TaxID=2791986 RepID=A0ABS1IWB4_9GAMM|nr:MULTISPECIES: hypothetical protein [Limnobaculum]MBK5145967.1 hypothetical protein [Limnobaculum allomyrinae]MBV7693978.1 hypothetical protein [Limnobaculum sp. M2-1]
MKPSFKYGLTGEDILHYRHRKTSLIDRVTIWIAAIGLIILAMLGMLGGMA